MSAIYSQTHSPDWEAFVKVLRHQGESKRVHHIELFLDSEVQEAICTQFDLLKHLDPTHPYYHLQRQIAIQRYLGYDYVRCGLDNFDMPLNNIIAPDTADLKREGGRKYIDEHTGPITNWTEFGHYPWPQIGATSTRSLEWFEKNLPDDMCIIASGGFAHFAEYITWLMGYETLCYALYDQRELVHAISQRLIEMYEKVLALLLQFNRVKVVWGSDDMGFRSGTLISPDDLREFVLPGHKLMATMAHAAGHPYLLHSCGKLTDIMPDLIHNVGIDGRHSFEDTIETVVDAKKRYGQDISLLGGIDMDFICRASVDQVRKRVRNTLDECMPGGGYCLGTGNTVANYIPLDNYFAMLDEGSHYA